MLEELRKDNESLVASMRETQALCDEKGPRWIEFAMWYDR